MYDQIQLFIDSLLSKYQCGLRRGQNAQHCSVSMIEKRKKSVVVVIFIIIIIIIIIIIKDLLYDKSHVYFY